MTGFRRSKDEPSDEVYNHQINWAVVEFYTECSESDKPDSLTSRNTKVVRKEKTCPLHCAAQKHTVSTFHLLFFIHNHWFNTPANKILQPKSSCVGNDVSAARLPHEHLFLDLFISEWLLTLFRRAVFLKLARPGAVYKIRHTTRLLFNGQK